ncbi:DUF4190 domain-containing protein [Mycolicibacterium aichiense]|uniref:Membrane protein n=1 Tax=Mycolicibacterium aichiense TaxID=1799 RepID=A0AAD1MCD7_9MYCO|nr:DUF4190 domain-containing protein [Mycolicibacterium aichiense]MCV7017555.1 DUF4190 domain-containing protein [Mycolicibacterium aichiense]BBX09347.1 membrane protein [Mycolicibacterium aichiense]SUA13913.1 integral membrane protein [Mycolicibacterium aichiense]
MTYPPHPEGTPPPADPYAPVDYPSNFPTMPPPVYPAPYPPPTAYPGYPYPPPAYPGYGDPYDPYRPTKPPGTNGKAIAALVTSLAGLLLCGLPSIAGIILGIVAMRETKRTGQDGFGLAVAGVAIGAVIIALIVLYIAFVVILAASTTTSPSSY